MPFNIYYFRTLILQQDNDRKVADVFPAKQLFSPEKHWNESFKYITSI